MAPHVHKILNSFESKFNRSLDSEALRYLIH